MRHILLGLSLAGFVFFAPVAHAAIVGVVPSNQVADFFNGKSNSYAIYSLKESTVTDIQTSVAQTNGGNVWQVGQKLYYNNTDGLYAQNVGTSTTTKVLTQKSLEGVLMLGKNWLISNSGKTDGGKSFFYNVTDKKLTKFTPTVKKIAAADNTSDKKTIVMIAKNGEGKQRLFLSTTSISKLREFPLPTKAKSCDGISIAPLGKTVIVGCAFTVTGSKTAKDGYAIYTRSGNDLKLVTRTVEDDSIVDLIWLDDQRVVIIDSASTGSIDIRKWTIAKGKITENEKLSSGGTTTDTDGQAISYAPFQLLRWTNNKFYYNTLYVRAADTETYLTLIGAYDISAGAATVISDNNDFRIVF